ncbi:MAG: response regulator [Anaerolineae bacterium]|nr:response regulator [Anaerolineae bacterium]
MNKKTVLYIEDNFHNRRIVRKILQSRGYEMIEAEDGLTGFRMIGALRPPLVLLDIALPGMDGLEVVRRVKADEDLRSIPVIALTASAMRGDKERFLDAGCDDYLSKPVRALELVEMVDDYFDGTREVDLEYYEDELDDEPYAADVDEAAEAPAIEAASEATVSEAQSAVGQEEVSAPVEAAMMDDQPDEASVAETPDEMESVEMVSAGLDEAAGLEEVDESIVDFGEADLDDPDLDVMVEASVGAESLQVSDDLHAEIDVDSEDSSKINGETLGELTAAVLSDIDVPEPAVDQTDEKPEEVKVSFNEQHLSVAIADMLSIDNINPAPADPDPHDG